MKIVKCSFCGKKIKIPPYRERFEHHFCCAEHHHKFMEEKFELICEYCGKKFLRCKKQINRASKHYCSNECRYLAQRKKNNYIEHKDYIEVIYKQYSILLDKEDFLEIKSGISVRDYKNEPTPYAFINNKPLHRVITNCPESRVVDHINHNGLDNRRNNLKICTQKENARNLKPGKRNTSGYIGVNFCKATNKWRAFITINGKNIPAGSYKKIEEAIIARKKLEEKYWNNC